MIKLLSVLKVIIECIVPLVGYLGKCREEKTLRAVAAAINAVEKDAPLKEPVELVKASIKVFTEGAGVRARLNDKLTKWGFKAPV